MNYKKIILLVSFLAVLGLLVNFGAPTAKATTVAEIQALIQQLQTQIAQLQKQLTEAQGTKTPSPIPIKPSITVLSPNGGEQFNQGTGLTIKWSSKGTDPINIDLLDYGRKQEDGSTPFVLNIVNNNPSLKGVFVWNIPSDWPAGNLYKIRIWENVKAGAQDDSDNYFSIVAATAKPAPSISISGSSGNQTNSSALTVNIGDNFTISGVPQNLQGLSYWFGSGYPPTGYYNRAYFFDQTFGNNNSCGNNEASVSGPWIMTCTAKVPGSSNFYIEIYANGQIYKSNVVSVTISSSIQPSITVLSPNGGEKWTIGNTYNIIWKANGFEKVATISLTDYSCSSEVGLEIAKNVLANQGGYSWKIPDNFFESQANVMCPTYIYNPSFHYGWKSGDNFKIFIAELKTETCSPPGGMDGVVCGPYGVQDESDNYFRIFSKE